MTLEKATGKDFIAGSSGSADTNFFDDWWSRWDSNPKLNH